MRVVFWNFAHKEFFNSICHFESPAQQGFRLDLAAGAGRKRHFADFNSGGDREVSLYIDSPTINTFTRISDSMRPQDEVHSPVRPYSWLAILLSSSKNKIVVPEGGSVVNASGGLRLYFRGDLEVDVVDFILIKLLLLKQEPATTSKLGKKGQGDSVAAIPKPCSINTVGLNSNEALAEIVTKFFQSDEVFYLQPIFEKAAEDVETPCSLPPAYRSNTPYVLPFKVGKTYPFCKEIVGHSPTSKAHFGNSPLTHNAIGTEVVAMRSGVVGYLVEEYDTNARFGDVNWVLVVHDNNAQSYYSHLAQNGVLVSVGIP